MRRHPNRPGILAATALFLLAPPASAANGDLGTFESWRSHRFVEAKQMSCSMWSQPQKAEGNYKRRGEIFAFVTHRPAEKRVDRLSFEIGYQFKPGSVLEVNVDGRRFSLYTDGSTAWSDSPEESKALVKLMRAGLRMVVEGESSRGTKTKDTYSLRGFTAAHNAISKACKVG